MKKKTSNIVYMALLACTLGGSPNLAHSFDPVFDVNFKGAADDVGLSPQSTAGLIGTGVSIGQGYAAFDGSSNAFIDYGNGASNELRLFGNASSDPLDELTIWARISSKQNGDQTGTRVIVSRWGTQQRAFQLGVKDDGKVFASFTSNGDWSGYVEVETVESRLVKTDASQTVDVAVRFDRGNVKVFVDGVEKTLSVDQVGNYQSIYNADASAKTVIGGIVHPGQTSASRSFKGIINNIKIYGQALSNSELGALSNSDRQAIYQLNAIKLGTLPTELNSSMSHHVIEGNKEYRAKPLPPEHGNMSLCPVVVELPNGTILAAYHRTTGVDFIGSYHTYLRSSNDGGKTWGEPRLVVPNAQAPGLLLLPNGDLLLNAAMSLDNEGNSTTMKLFRSSNHGISWTEQAPIWQESSNYIGQGGAGGLFRLSTGRILLPVQESDGNAYMGLNSTYKTLAYFSDNNGSTWQKGAGNVTLLKRGAMEPSVAELPDGSILMSMRTQLGELYLSKSADGGNNWSPAWASGLEMAESNQAIARIPGTNDLFLVWTSAPYNPQHDHSGDRTPLSYAMSKDYGVTWHKLGDIVGGNHELGTASGNAILFTSNGKVMIANTLNTIPWDRVIVTGSTHISLAALGYFYSEYSNKVDPSSFLESIKLSGYRIVQNNDWNETSLRNVGDQARLTTTGILSDGGKRHLTHQVSYTSNKPSVATVSSSGVVTVVGKGRAVITAQVVQGSNTLTATYNIETTDLWTVVNPNGSETQYHGNGWYIRQDWNYCTRSADDNAEFDFIGTDVKLFVEAGPNAGYADIYIDNQFMTTIDSYQPVWGSNNLLFSATGLTHGSHTLKAVAKNERNPASGNNGLFINKFEFVK